MDSYFLDKINNFRLSIDNFDSAIIYLLAERFKCTQKIGYLKAIHKLPPVDAKRENEQIKRLSNLAKSVKLNSVFIKKIFNLITNEVANNHKEISKNLKFKKHNLR